MNPHACLGTNVYYLCMCFFVTYDTHTEPYEDHLMRPFDSNIIMLLLLILTGLYLGIRQILSLPLSNTAVMLSFIVLFFIVVVLHGWKTLGTRECLVFFLFAYSIALLYEYTDGLGFGILVDCTWSYSGVLGSKILGKIPLVIPLVWSIFMYCSLTMTNILFRRIRTTRASEETFSLQWFGMTLGMGIVAGLITASLDLLIDPVMVAMGAWSWSAEGPYFGIPLWNYEGWIEIPAVTFVCYSLYLLVVKKNQMYIGGENRSRYTLVVVAVYLIVFLVYGVAAIEEQVAHVIPWAMIPVVFFSGIVIVQFHRSVRAEGKKDSSSII